MEDKNAVNYFLFNDRKSTLRCSFILICSLTFFEFYSCFTYILPLLYPKHGTILFYLLPFSFSNHLHFQPTFPFLFLNKNSFSTPPQSLCTKGMATLSCNSYDIAPQKQCNCHLKALLLERKSYSFAPQWLCPQPTRALK